MNPAVYLSALFVLIPAVTLTAPAGLHQTALTRALLMTTTASALCLFLPVTAPGVQLFLLLILSGRLAANAAYRVLIARVRAHGHARTRTRTRDWTEDML